MSDSVRPHRQQPTRLPCPWDSPGKNTGVGCHFLLQCMTVKNEIEVVQLCPTLSDPIDCSPPGSSVHGIFQARVLEWDAITFSVIIIKYTLISHSPMQVSLNSYLLQRSGEGSYFNARYTLLPEKAMAPHSSTLAWKIPWMEGPGGLQSVGSLGVGHN